MCRIYGFAPIIDGNSKILILGTLPGPDSLKKNQYYGNSRNHFWTIVFSVFNCEPLEDYMEKCNFLLEKRIALWDVLLCAERKGGEDAAIKNEVPNNLDELLSRYPNIESIILAGTAAEKYYRKHFGNIDKRFNRVSSTSPTPGKNVKSLDEKIVEWKRYLMSAEA